MQMRHGDDLGHLIEHTVDQSVMEMPQAAAPQYRTQRVPTEGQLQDAQPCVLDVTRGPRATV